MKYIVALVLCAVSTILVVPAYSTDDCLESNCKIEDNCKCSSSQNPLAVDDAPLLISLTFDEAIVKDGVKQYWVPLLLGRTNPDGLPISATFFVPHEYSDYELVNTLYSAGYEIGVHSVTKNPHQSYWRNASLDTLTHEFGDQKKIITIYSNIPADDIQGVRTPQLQIEGDVTIKAYDAAGLSYDSSWPTMPKKPLFPYTLDYKTSQNCDVSVTCPTESFPGFWVLPIIDLNGNETHCNSLASCGIEGSADDISNWLLGEVDNIRKNGNRAPLTLLVNSFWFNFTENSYDGLSKFFDALPDYPDVFLVSQRQVLEWMKNPVPLSDFQTEDTSGRVADCYDPVTCQLPMGSETMNFRTCTPCPKVYPWLGNPEGNPQ